MIFISRNASELTLLTAVRECVDMLSSEDFDGLFAQVGYGLAFQESGAACIREAIDRYRSAECFPGIENFLVTYWRTAITGNPAPAQQITWYKPNCTGLAGAVAFDLPLNGRWSDLTCNFVLFDVDNGDRGYALNLEDIESSQQWQRENP